MLRVAAERPDVEKEIANIESEVAGTRSRLDRYYEAFEQGTMKPEACGAKVEELNARLGELDAELRKLKARRQQLELPALDRDAVSALMDEFENVVASGTNPQRKHLLHRLVKKVLVRDRQTVEVWYGLPVVARSPRGPAPLAPRVGRFSTHSLPREGIGAVRKTPTSADASRARRPLPAWERRHSLG